MSFSGWPEEALDFYEELEIDNSKAYWTRHKRVYEEKILAPMAELAGELAPEFGEARIFRPYRDIRFSKDKSPYKTNIAAMIGSGYVHLSAKGLAAGDGMYHMTPGQLDRYRRAVTSEDSGCELERITAALRERDITVTCRDALKTAPRGYSADHPRIALLRYKGLIAWKEWPAGAWLGTAEARDRVVTFLRTTRPISAWLHEHVGPEHAED
jgi:uncharacterized protein (TIGR02453 family)